MKLALARWPFEDVEIWRVDRAEHDGSSWQEPVPRFGGVTYTAYARRLRPEADVEGSRAEMVDVADAVERRGKVCFKRVAVDARGDEVLLWSPRCSDGKTAVSREEALDLARQIRERCPAPDMGSGPAPNVHEA